ncbi:MAG: hypothetical protein WAP51_02840 [Candidatus Sungiibacteriota bacterium]
MTQQEALIAVLKKSFADCWSRETSLDEEGWTPENPSYGHCAIASLIAQRVLGGELLRYDLKGTPFEHMRSHYMNRLPDGTIVDFTEAQFGVSVPVLPEPVVRKREEVLDPVKYPKTVERYKLCSKRVREWLDSFRNEK